ncbi:VOC family protein [Jannaschia sp. Os4]|uniref:VOC family protein n=1 Tax=Jannaschia sp. Os4 TaxID=2807617 RepID=UPI00193A1123|nr:VOC family protein [Jannaschia sp. Os4]
MTHRSRLGVVVIDCETDDLSAPLAFWSAALGLEGRIDARGKYATFADAEGYPRLLLQAVDHAPRVHLDVETDDQEAERARLERLGATVVDRCDHGWIVMEAPTGHRFCLVNPQTNDFPGHAPVWED